MFAIPQGLKFSSIALDICITQLFIQKEKDGKKEGKCRKREKKKKGKVYYCFTYCYGYCVIRLWNKAIKAMGRAMGNKRVIPEGYITCQ